MLATQKTEPVNATNFVRIIEEPTFAAISIVTYGLSPELLNGASYGIQRSGEIDMEDLAQ
jgi:hypothetical protein